MMNGNLLVCAEQLPSFLPLIVSKCGNFLFPPMCSYSTQTVNFIKSLQQYQTLFTVPIIYKQGQLIIGYFSLYPQLHIQYLPQQNPIINIRNRKLISFNLSENDIIILSSIRPIENCYVHHRTKICIIGLPKLLLLVQIFLILNHEAFCLCRLPSVHTYKH